MASWQKWPGPGGMRRTRQSFYGIVGFVSQAWFRPGRCFLFSSSHQAMDKECPTREKNPLRHCPSPRTLQARAVAD
jgi:hypothetical protein